MPSIANTTVISNFAQVGQLERLQRLWRQLYISDKVFDEIQAGLLQGYTFYTGIEQHIFPFSQTGWLHLTACNTPEEFRTFGQLLTTLHSGEASCLAIASHRKWTFLSDDKAARKASHTLNVPLSGTLGILLSLVKQGYYLYLRRIPFCSRCSRPDTARPLPPWLIFSKIAEQAC